MAADSPDAMIDRCCARTAFLALGLALAWLVCGCGAEPFESYENLQAWRLRALQAGSDDERLDALRQLLADRQVSEALADALVGAMEMPDPAVRRLSAEVLCFYSGERREEIAAAVADRHALERDPEVKRALSAALEQLVSGIK